MIELTTAPAGMWRMPSGTVLPISQVPTIHLEVTVRLLQRHGFLACTPAEIAEFTAAELAAAYRTYYAHAQSLARSTSANRRVPRGQPTATPAEWLQLCHKLAELDTEQQRRKAALLGSLFTNLPPELQ